MARSSVLVCLRRKHQRFNLGQYLVNDDGNTLAVRVNAVLLHQVREDLVAGDVTEMEVGGETTGHLLIGLIATLRVMGKAGRDKPFERPLLHTIHGVGYRLYNPR